MRLLSSTLVTYMQKQSFPRLHNTFLNAGNSTFSLVSAINHVLWFSSGIPNLVSCLRISNTRQAFSPPLYLTDNEGAKICRRNTLYRLQVLSKAYLLSRVHFCQHRTRQQFLHSFLSYCIFFPLNAKHRKYLKIGALVF